MSNKSKGWLLADEGLELYRQSWKKKCGRLVRDCLAEVIDRELCPSIGAKRGRGGADIKLDWFFLDNFLILSQDKPNKKGVRMQKRKTTFNYNEQPYTVTFERGDKLNKRSK